MNTFKSDLSGKEFPESERVSAETITHSVLNLIQSDHPDFKHNGVLSSSELKEYKKKHLKNFFSKKLTREHEEVIKSVNNGTLISEEMENEEENEKSTFGERVADKIAEFSDGWFSQRQNTFHAKGFHRGQGGLAAFKSV